LPGFLAGDNALLVSEWGLEDSECPQLWLIDGVGLSWLFG